MDYSVIIPAFNEEDYLPQTLERLRLAMEQVEGKGEVILVDNNSTDQTAAIAGAQGVKVLFEPINQISRARNRGAEAARGGLLFFLDADTHPHPEAMTEALRLHRTESLAGGGALLAYPTYNRGVALWNWISRTFGWAAGGFFFCDRSAFFEIGGFSERVYASEEIWFSMRIKRWGRKQGRRFVILETAPILTSDRKLHWFGPIRYGAMFLMMLLMPWVIFSPRFLPLWYRRPE